MDGFPVFIDYGVVSYPGTLISMDRIISMVIQQYPWLYDNIHGYTIISMDRIIWYHYYIFTLLAPRIRCVGAVVTLPHLVTGYYCECSLR